MVSGFDKYYQIARCFRDEDFRADRQPEFTQIDYEMSFVDQEDVMDITERLLVSIFKNVLGIDIKEPFEVMEYERAMETYGTDKPDLRYGLPIKDITDVLADCSFEPIRNALSAGGVVKGIIVPSVAQKYSRKVLEDLEAQFKKYGLKNLIAIKVEVDVKDTQKLSIKSSIEKYMTEKGKQTILDTFGLNSGDILFVAFGEKKRVLEGLGALRSDLAKREKLLDKNAFRFVWITRFPMFSYSEEEQRYVAEHHPFTMPDSDELARHTNGDILKVHAKAYDIVLNGWEIGGGSVRIHSREIQKKVFSLLGIPETEQKTKFGFLLDAFQFGVPPHAGCAIGLDRLVAIIAGEEYIRDVIPFPKTTSGICQMTDAPSEVDKEQLEKLSLKISKDPR
jgi:aspartyl-tRNA synthetase